MESGERTYETYGQAIRHHGLLDRDGELALAAEIEARSIALWKTVLSHRATAAVAARLAAERLPDAAPLFEMKSVTAAAKRLHELDVDHVIADQAVAHIAAAREPALAAQAATIEAAAREVADARRRFIHANIGLVMHLASRYRSTTLSLEDFVQEGMFGLIKAVDRFDHRRGLRFSTFATWWIRHHIGRALADTGRLIRLPVHRQDTRKRLATLSQNLRSELGRDPTPDELAVAAGISRDKLDEINQAGILREIRLDAPVGDDHEQTRIDIFADSSSEESEPGDVLDLRTLTDAARALLPTLKPIEREVLRRRFGLEGDDREETFREIASDHGLSRERIRQIEATALRKLRDQLAPLVAQQQREQHAA